MNAALPMMAGGVLLCILAPFFGEHVDLLANGVDSRSLVALAYLIVAGSLVAFTAYLWLMRHVRAERVATYA